MNWSSWLWHFIICWLILVDTIDGQNWPLSRWKYFYIRQTFTAYCLPCQQCLWLKSTLEVHVLENVCADSYHKTKHSTVCFCWESFYACFIFILPQLILMNQYSQCRTSIIQLVQTSDYHVNFWDWNHPMITPAVCNNYASSHKHLWPFEVTHNFLKHCFTKPFFILYLEQ